MERPDFGQGIRGNPRISRPVTSREDLQWMTPAEIDHARRTGQLDELLGKDTQSD